MGQNYTPATQAALDDAYASYRLARAQARGKVIADAKRKNAAARAAAIADRHDCDDEWIPVHPAEFLRGPRA
jgi:hypothetical protein